jgi:uncharacterized protein YegP (UPF0339 family)
MANEPRFEVYPRQATAEDSLDQIDLPAEYGWRFRAANGQISAVAGEGFRDRTDARRAVRAFCATVTDVSVVVSTDGLVAADIPIVDVDD